MVSRLRKPAEVEDGARRLRRRQGRHPDRHPPAALARRPRQGPRPGHRRRGAALRGQAEGAAAPAEAEGRRALAVGDADPAHAADEPRRAARHLGDRDAARGPAPGPHLRRPLRRGAGRARRSSARSSATGQAFFLHNRIETLHEVAERLRALVPGGPLRRGPRPDGRGASSRRRCSRFLRGDADCLVATTIIESGLDIPQREHADRRARRPARPRAGLPDPRPGRPLSRARLRLPALPLRGGARPRRRRRVWRRSPTTPSSAPASRSRCATSSCAAPATCSATSSPATSPRSASSSTCQMLDEAVERAARGRGRRGAAGRGRSASTSTSTPTCPPTTSPSRRRRSTSTAGSPAPARPASCGRSATSFATASARCRSRSRTCSRCSGPGSSSAPPGRATVEVRGGRLSIDPARARRGDGRRGPRADPGGDLRARATETLSLRVGDEPAERLASVLALTEALSAALAAEPVAA